MMKAPHSCREDAHHAMLTEDGWCVVSACAACSRPLSTSAERFGDRASAEQLAESFYAMDADFSRRETELAAWLRLGLDDVTAEALAFAGCAFESDDESESE